MDILQCKICNKPFQSLGGGKICYNCLEQMEKDFVAVRDYIYENERAEMDEVSEKTGVSKNVILHFLKEGRLTTSSASGVSGIGGMLTCEVCRKPIDNGKMCNNCKKNLASKMQKSLGIEDTPVKKEKVEHSSRSSAKMHVQHKK